MQLFLLDHIDLKWNDIIIDHPEIWQQAKKVLRLWSGDKIFVQRQAENQQSVRYEVEVTALKDFKLFGTVVATTQSNANDKQIMMIIAMPNKREKAELIAQKLTEIGVNEIIFRPSERSIIREWNEKKAIRLEKIMKEALEQSRWWHLPKIMFCPNIDNYLQDSHVIIFDKSWEVEGWEVGGWINLLSQTKSSTLNNSHSEVQLSTVKSGLIWPEGGRWPKDYALFKKYNCEVKDLWATVLRMETAAIVGAWVMKNSL